MSKKRKRHEEEEGEAGNDAEQQDAVSVSVDDVKEEEESRQVLDKATLAHVQKKIFHATRETSRAFKKAKDFEVRKIIKRIKAATVADDSQKVSRLEKELHIAKTLDIHPYAERHLHKILESDALVSGYPQLLPQISEIPPTGEDDSIIKNLVGRLVSAASIKATTSSLLRAIHRAAGIEQDIERLPPRQTPKTNLQKKSDPLTSRLSSPLTRSTAFIRSDAPPPESDIKDHYEDEDEDEEGSCSDDADPTPKKILASSPPEPARKRTVLPALSTGYIPASDSDSDPDEEFNSFAPTAKIRKNRRGQRERQGIWLKKYGSNARHLHPELKADNRPVKEMKARPEWVRPLVGSEGTGETVMETPKEVKKVNDPHPSWTAKQKLREQQKTLANSVKPQKIVFD